SGSCAARSLCCAARSDGVVLLVFVLLAAPRAGVTCAARSIVAVVPVFLLSAAWRAGVPCAARRA
ncbi:hypothetical protein A2U01_0071917, partial [Trifolium medium]|nr:hypothetical protein [Trifolium medium]